MLHERGGTTVSEGGSSAGASSSTDTSSATPATIPVKLPYVVPELCIMCGNCVLACPSSAKRVRDDLPSVKELLRSGRKVIASLAPSFVAQFTGVRPAQVVHALKELGFFAVSETALGAQGPRKARGTARHLLRSLPAWRVLDADGLREDEVAESPFAGIEAIEKGVREWLRN